MSGLRIGSRGSALALAQASWVKRQIEEHDPIIGSRAPRHQNQRRSVSRNGRSKILAARGFLPRRSKRRCCAKKLIWRFIR